MKRFCTLVGLVIAGTALSVLAFEITDDLRLRLQQRIEEIETTPPKMSDMMTALREAGASYLPEIVAPADADKYQSAERRRLITGVYIMDLTYATTFNQRKPAAAYGQAIYQLLDQLGFPNPGMERQYREALADIDQPGGEEQLQELLRKQDEDINWQEKMKTPEGAAFVVDSVYGFLIEALYLTGEISAASNYNADYLQYIANMRESFLAYKDILKQFEQDAATADLMAFNERVQFITSILDVLGDAPQIGPEEIEELRPVLHQAREDILK